MDAQNPRTTQQPSAPDASALRRRTDQADARAAELDAHFRSSFRVLWLIAIGIVGDAATAEDVVQEAAVIALTNLDHYQAGSNFAAWAGQIVRNVALNRARSDRRRRTTEFSDIGDLADASDQPSPLRHASPAPTAGPQEPDAGEFHRELLAALSDVAEIPRACLLLRTVEGLGYTEISRLLEIPEGTAMSHVHRTRQALRERLSTAWSDSSMDTKKGS